MGTGAGAGVGTGAAVSGSPARTALSERRISSSETVVAMRAQRGIHFASGWMSLMYNFGGGFLDQETIASGEPVVTCTTPETVSSLDFYVNLLNCAPPDVGT